MTIAGILFSIRIDYESPDSGSIMLNMLIGGIIAFIGLIILTIGGIYQIFFW